MNQTFQCDGSTALVKTSKGQIKGYEHNGLSVFKGIPYAKAKRFHAPEPAEKWDGVFDAASYGFVCPLLSNERPGGELYVPHRYWPMDEDCLNLNIWTPGRTMGSGPCWYGSMAAAMRLAPPSSRWLTTAPTWRASGTRWWYRSTIG